MTLGDVKKRRGEGSGGRSGGHSAEAGPRHQAATALVSAQCGGSDSRRRMAPGQKRAGRSAMPFAMTFSGTGLEKTMPGRELPSGSRKSSSTVTNIQGIWLFLLRMENKAEWRLKAK